MTNAKPKSAQAIELRTKIVEGGRILADIIRQRQEFYKARATGTATTETSINDRAAHQFLDALDSGRVLTSLEVPHSFGRDEELGIMQRGIETRLKALRKQLDDVLWGESCDLAESMLPAWRELAREHALLAVRLKSVEIRAREMLGQLVTGSGNFPLWDFVGVAEIIYPGQPIDGGVDNEANAALAAKIVTASELREAKNVDRK